VLDVRRVDRLLGACRHEGRRLSPRAKLARWMQRARYCSHSRSRWCSS
jgi:hypothetical protein